MSTNSGSYSLGFEMADRFLQLIKAGEGIIASNQSANRDEDIFENPDQFNMHRKFKHDALGFGFGPHRCIAETLAKTELTTVFCESLLFRCDLRGNTRN